MIPERQYVFKHADPLVEAEFERAYAVAFEHGRTVGAQERAQTASAVKPATKRMTTITLRHKDYGVEALLTLGAEPVSIAVTPTLAGSWDLIKEAVEEWVIKTSQKQSRS